MNQKASISTIRWKDVEPGSIVLDIPMIDGKPALDFLEFPVITEELKTRLQNRYMLKPDRTIRILTGGQATLMKGLSEQFSRRQKRLDNANRLREELSKALKEADRGLRMDRIYDSSSKAVDQESIRRNVFNSVPELKDLVEFEIPGFIDNLEKSLNIADLLTQPAGPGRILLPTDNEVRLHLVIDASYSVFATGLWDLIQDSLNLLLEHILKLYPSTDLFLYGFGEECVRMDFPIDTPPISSARTLYGSFLEMASQNLSQNSRNHIILITDGKPEDLEQIHTRARWFRERKVDFTQIGFGIDEKRGMPIKAREGAPTVDGILLDRADQLGSFSTREMKQIIASHRKNLTGFVNMMNGNQAIIQYHQLVGLFTVEMYDRYQGILTLADSMN